MVSYSSNSWDELPVLRVGKVENLFVIEWTGGGAGKVDIVGYVC